MYAPLFRLPRALHSNKIARFRVDTNYSPANIIAHQEYAGASQPPAKVTSLLPVDFPGRMVLDILRAAQYLCPFSGPARVRCVFFLGISVAAGFSGAA
jgi:hypothetical protein